MTMRSWARKLFTRPATRPFRKVRHRARLALEALEDRTVPSGLPGAYVLDGGYGGGSSAGGIPYNGGPLLTHVEVQGVYYNDPATLGLQSQLDGLFSNLVQSSWATQMLANFSVPGYTVGAGSFLGDDDTGVTVPEGGTLSDAAIQSQLSSELASGRLAAPDGNTVYAVYAPAGVEVTAFGANSVGDFLAYHDSFIDPASGKELYYMVLPYEGAAPDGRTGPQGPNASYNDGVRQYGLPASADLTEFQELTAASSHELSEAITDPSDPLPGWYSDSLGELADAANALVTYHGYVIEEVWAHNPTDPPGLALGPGTWPADTDFAVTQVNNPTAGGFSGVFATFTDKDGASQSPSQFQVGLQWGDWSFSRTGDGTGDLTVTSNGDGTFNIVGSHIYDAPAGTTETAYLFVRSGDDIAWQIAAPIVLQKGVPRPSFVVNTTADDLSYAGGTTSLREAILAANYYPGHTVTFDPAVFATPQTITLTLGALELTNATGTETIEGPAAGVTISGNNASRGFVIDSGVTASLWGLTITGGKTAGSGGGLDNWGTATLTDCTISGNAATKGGGVDNWGTVTLTDCTVSGNAAGNRGGGLDNIRGTMTLTDCTVSSNIATGNGGGLANSGGTLTLTRCAVSGNTSTANVRPSGGAGVYSGGGTTTLTNCTITGNSAVRDGGGIFAYGGTLTVANCTVSGNSARIGGGGLFTDGTSLTMTNSTFHGNSAFAGGAMELIGATQSLTNCTISGNTASLGGGANIGGTTTLTDCTISGNTASYSGGGLDNYGSATLTGCTVSGNSARYGGGLENFGTATLTGCTVSGNSAAVEGGGLDNSIVFYGGGLFNQGTLALTGCTVSGNTAGIFGGGLDNYGTATLTDCTVSGNTAVNGGGVSTIGYSGYFGQCTGTTNLTNCTVSGNSAANGGAGLYSAASMATLTLTNTIVAGNVTTAAAASDITGPAAGTNNLIGTGGAGGLVNGAGGNLVGVANALLAPLGNYGGPTQTMPLLPGSLAIDAGITAGAPTTDQRGQGRVGAVDIGAFESQGFTIAVTSGGGQATDIATAFAAPLIVTVTANNPGEPVAGGRITFTALSGGASAALGGSPTTISAAGTASVTATANGSAGSYTVSVTAQGITTPASFGLSNRPTFTVPAAQTAYQNVDQAISGIVLGDAPGATLTVTLSVNHGTLTLGTTSGLKVTGNGSGAVTLTGTTAALNAALASLVYRGDRNYSGGDPVSLTAIDGGVSATPASVAITVESIAQEAADLQAQVGSLQAAGVLNQGQANSLIAKLDLKGNNGDLGKVQALLNEVAADLSAGILTQAQADALLYWGNILLLSVMRR